MTSTFLEDLQEEVSPVTVEDIQEVSANLIKGYEEQSEVSLESSIFTNFISNARHLIRRTLVTGSYEPESVVPVTFDPNVVKWLLLRERLVKAPVTLNTNPTELVELLSVLYRDVFFNLEDTLSSFNKTLAMLVNKPETLTSISGNTGLIVDKTKLVSLVSFNKIKGSLVDRPVSVKIGRLFNNVTEIKTLATKLQSVNLDFSRIELKDILAKHERTVELIETLVKDAGGLSSGSSAKNMIVTMTGLAVTLETLSIAITVLDKVTLLINEVVRSTNEAHQITIEENKA